MSADTLEGEDRGMLVAIHPESANDYRAALEKGNIKTRIYVPDSKALFDSRTCLLVFGGDEEKSHALELLRGFDALFSFKLPRNPDRKMLAMKRIRGIDSVRVKGFRTTRFKTTVVTVRAPKESVEQIRAVLAAVRAL